MKKQTTAGAAFTLVELLAVIAVIALLAALILPAINKAIDRALAVQCKNNLKQLGVGITLYQSDHNGKFPLTRTDRIDAGNSDELYDQLLGYLPFIKEGTTHVNAKNTCRSFEKKNDVPGDPTVGSKAFSTRFQWDDNTTKAPTRRANGHPGKNVGGWSVSQLKGQRSAPYDQYTLGYWTPGEYGIIYDKGFTSGNSPTNNVVPNPDNPIPAHMIEGVPFFNILFADAHVGTHPWIRQQDSSLSDMPIPAEFR